MTHIKNHLSDLAAYLLGTGVIAGLCFWALEVCVRGACV
jgi:hypothetical protein